MPEGRGSLIEDLRMIRRNLQEAIEGAAFLSRKFHGPAPKDSNDAKLSNTESVSVLVADIQRHSSVLMQIMREHHEFVGNLESENAPGRAELATASSRY
jgi:hypothetical protein